MPFDVIVLLATLAVATGVGLLWRRHNGHFRGAASAVDVSMPASDPGRADESDDPRHRRTPFDIPGVRGEQGTLLQFSSAFCAPCRSTRRVLGEVAAMVPGVTHVEVDAESHLDLVRRLGVVRTPTTFVLDAEGLVVSRASGAPRRADVIAALGRAIH